MNHQLALQPNRLAVPTLLRNAWAFNRTLTIFLITSILFSAIGILGMVLDLRIVLGMPNWAKSTKFGLSLALYGASLLWVLPMLTKRPRLTQFIAHGSGTILLLEIGLIMLQAVRGVPIHFNMATPFDAALWMIMSITITILWVITAIAVSLLFFQNLQNRITSWSLRLGLLITLLGFTQGYLMTGPNREQLAALESGQRVDLIGAHTVGRADGGSGIPLLGWSTTHGDLRIGHFIGIHAIQAIPLLGIILIRRRERWLGERSRLALVCIGALGYFGLMALVTWQALREQPLLSPDTLTLQVAAGLVIAVLSAMVGVVLAARIRSSQVY
jgi:hypothetical protein